MSIISFTQYKILIFNDICIGYFIPFYFYSVKSTVFKEIMHVNINNDDNFLKQKGEGIIIFQ